MDPVYPVLFVEAVVVKVRDGQVRNTPFYVVMGVTTNGEREILCTWAGDGGEGARFWLQVFSELKNRGVEDVLIAVCEGLKGLLEAITTTWERTVVQQWIVHLIRNSFRYAGRQHRDGIVKALKPVYTARPSKRRRTASSSSRRNGASDTSHRAALGILLGRVLALSGIRRGNPTGDLHDERNRVDQRTLPEEQYGPAGTFRTKLLP